MFWIGFLIVESSFPQYMYLKFPWMIAYICGTAGQGERKFYLRKSDIHISVNLQRVHSTMFYPINKFEFGLLIFTCFFHNPLLWWKSRKICTYIIFCFEIIITRTNEECSHRDQSDLVLEDRVKGGCGRRNQGDFISLFSSTD